MPPLRKASKAIRSSLPMIADVFGVRISQGALGNMLRRGGEAFAARKGDILARLRHAEAERRCARHRRPSPLRGT